MGPVSETTFARCPTCLSDVAIPRWTAFKAKATAGGVIGGTISGATAGSIYGAGAGVASGGTAVAGTVPFGIVGGALGGLALGIAGKVGADWAAAKVKCRADGCGTEFRI